MRPKTDPQIQSLRGGSLKNNTVCVPRRIPKSTPSYDWQLVGGSVVNK